jgi:hypothetical protein
MMWVVEAGGEVGEEVLRRREAPTRKREYGPVHIIIHQPTSLFYNLHPKKYARGGGEWEWTYSKPCSSLQSTARLEPAAPALKLGGSTHLSRLQLHRD